MLTEKQVALLRDELATAKNPLFFYDGDGDGLASFQLLYRLNREGRGYALRTTSKLDIQLLRKVEEWQPDKIFVLDIPLMTQEFVDACKLPIFWIDHHPVQDLKNVTYFNPRIKDPDAYIPTSRMCWQISQKKEDLWLATAGCLADWHMPDFIDDFIEAYPSYLAKKYDLPRTVFKEKVGLLVKSLFFLQKGPNSEVRKSMKVLTRVESPDEIFQQTTAQGKFLFKRFDNINSMYDVILKDARKKVTRSRVLLYFYTADKWSFTANLANELIALYPKKYVIIAREKSGEVKCSLRGVDVLGLLQEALIGTQGRGGGHPPAAGAVIPSDDWKQFLEKFTELAKKKLKCMHY